ncbi:hypothetical protein MEG05_15620 [Vibrio aestuarianus]|uniref:hypothetical protein n=1 Tax=Vibrio aestuarianus TaxID=28171 RepID=UPI00237CE365|nr:hypothetical protein [Vibrio aestuarianus]MDE1315486.1 hypothetical protein [Vibrio aestuarianus]
MRKVLYFSSIVALFFSPSVFSVQFNGQNESEKLQYIADVNKRSPHEGAILYQMDGYYTFQCGESASLNQLLQLKKTKSFQSLVVRSQKNELYGINKVMQTFKEFKEELPCKNL